jgi:hypothetical protein
MAGLNLDMRMGGSARAGAQARYGNSPAPTTATEAAYGTALAPSGGLSSLLMPNDATGVALWVGVAGLAWLLFLYYSLPEG